MLLIVQSEYSLSSMNIHQHEYSPDRVSISVFGERGEWSPLRGGTQGGGFSLTGGGMARDAVATYYSNIYQLDSSIDISYCDKRLVLSCGKHNLI